MDEKAASGADGPPDPTHPRTSAIDTEHHYPHRSDPTAFGRHSLQITQQQKPTSTSHTDGQRRYGVTPSTRDEDINDEKRSRTKNLPDINTPRRPASAPHNQPSSPNSPKNRTARLSHDFNRRYDGPFSRPSPVMTRRSTHSPTRPSPDPTTPHPGEPPEPPNPPTAIALFWTFILIDSIAMPIALYFGLWYGVGPGTNIPTEKREKLSPNTVFTIVTASVGGASIVEYFVRFWRLWRKGSTCRVIGAHRWYLDWFHWNFSLAWIIIMIELIVCTIPKNPPIHLLSLPAPTMLLTFGTQLLLIDVLRALHIPSPIRISSIPRHAQLRPGIYSLIEDICAVDGSGGTEFRVALDRRYEASHVFRAMLRRVGVFWAVGAEGCAVVCVVLVFMLDGEVGYVVGWSLPFVWAGVWTGATFWYVKRELKREAKAWREEVARKGVAGSTSSV
ncbi:hypothetical protein BDP81DRAFT_405593 [Colletotrichum phormii]|uniref:Uncharacterized protein n=1 Tax=Colletotrichum phormii TaxID=359342 RepID=A0AAJ0EFZ6_9PEZI|nr:uncharacterized protein BDP81DRAFT_405593 [Colletotrichum phormii]KAK1637509.1 hypothetical protein BDP81DRAFT_405593 [Colletotrichum phormii]